MCLKKHQKAVFFSKKENLALSEHACVTNHEIAWEDLKIITTNPLYSTIKYVVEACPPVI